MCVIKKSSREMRKKSTWKFGGSGFKDFRTCEQEASKGKHGSWWITNPNFMQYFNGNPVEFAGTLASSLIPPNIGK